MSKKTTVELKDFQKSHDCFRFDSVMLRVGCDKLHMAGLTTYKAGMGASIAIINSVMTCMCSYFMSRVVDAPPPHKKRKEKKERTFRLSSSAKVEGG